MENFCYRVVNHASRFKDTSKIKTLGPYAGALLYVINGAQESRKDIDTSKYSECDLYRGAGMTSDEIKQYKDSIGKSITLYGYSSTSIDESLALSFAWENTHSGHQKVLFHI